MARTSLFLALAALAVAAGPVNYSEAASGDLSGFGAPLTTFAFDVGTNTISGTFGREVTFDRDSFAFTVPVGAELVFGGVSLTDALGDVAITTWDFRSGSANYAGGTFLEELKPRSPGSASLTSAPLGPGTYNLTHATLEALSDSTADYTFTFEVQSSTAAVPEPGSLALLAVGGLSLLGYARRRAGHAARRPAE